MDIRKLLTKFDNLSEGSMASAKKKANGPKFPGYLKGTDPASLSRSRMVGSSESQETVLKDLEKELVEGAIERKLKEQFANFNEFRQTPDDGDDSIDENTLKHLAAQWWNGDEDPRIERTLMSIGWEIGRDEGYDNAGAFVIQAGDESGNSYISWPAEELEGLTESRDLCHVCGQTPCNCTHVSEATELPPPENARKTQIAGTLPTYKKAAEILTKTGVKGRALDFGAGLGHGTKELGKGAHSYEPFPGEKFKPHFVDILDIPDNSYHKIVNLNVLNVVPNAGKQRIRDSIVKNIGRVLAPGGVAIITTRGKDVLTIKGTPGEEPMSMISKIGTYQKGFTSTELQEYVQGLLGEEFTVSKIKLGPAGIMIKKHHNVTEEEEDDLFAPSTRAADQIAASGWRRGGSMNGTSLKGYIETTFDNLEDVFGPPIYGPDDSDADKVTCEWVITFKDGKVATIYDYKLGRTPYDLYDWHIGGNHFKVVDYIRTLMDGKGAIKTSLWEGNNNFARNVFFNVSPDKIELAQAISKTIAFYPTSRDGVWKYSVMKNENREKTVKKITQLEKYFGPYLVSGKSQVRETGKDAAVKQGLPEDDAMEARIHNPKRVNVYYKPGIHSSESRVVATNIPASTIDALINKLSEKFDVSPTDFVWSSADNNQNNKLNSNVEEDQLDEVGMTTSGMAGMTGGGQQPAKDPAQDAKDLTTAQQNLNKLKSAGIALPTGVSQAAKTVVGVTNNPTAPQTARDRQTTGALGQGLEQLLAKGDPGQINQLANMVKKVQQGGQP